MGSWNKTCGLSNLHITAGTPVYVFMLEQNDVATDRCYSTAFWRPTLLPFLSQYNDYGGGENSHKNINYILDGLKSKLVEMDIGENQYHDIAVKADEMNEELLFEAVHEGRLKVRCGRDVVQVDFTMIRKDVVDRICNNWVQTIYVGDGNGTIGYGRNYIEHKFSDVLDAVPGFVEELMAISTPFGVYDKLDRPDYKHPLSRYLGRSDYRFGTIVRLHELIQSLVDAGQREHVESTLRDYLLGSFINAFMDECRKVWIPGCHEGSQSMEHTPYRVLNNAISEVLDAEEAEFEDD